MRSESLVALLRLRRVWVPVLLVVVFAVFLSRRGDTLLWPGVWAEDGVVILPSILSDGLSSLTQTVGGYLNSTGRVIDLIAAAISASQYALIGTVLAWIFSAAVVLAIALSPTLLRLRPLAALAVVLIPTGPEVFGIALYTFWWAGLLLLLVALWRPENPSIVWRSIFLIVGGLSSPLIIVVLPVLWIRAGYWRSRAAEWVAAGVGTVTAGFQAWAVLADGGRATQFSTFPDMRFIVRFFGDYVWGSWTDSPWVIAAIAPIVVGLIVWVVWRIRVGRLALVILGYLLAASILVSLLRAGGTPIDPITAGPRYFFYPFVLLSWILLLLAHAWRGRWMMVVPLGILVAATVNAAGSWSGHNDDLRWTAHVRSCTHFPDYRLPIHTWGYAGAAWPLTLDGDTCRAWLAQDPFPSDNAGSYAYRVQPVADVPQDLIVQNSAIRGVSTLTPTMTDAPASGVVVYASDDNAAITISMSRGDALYVRTDGETDGLTVTVESDIDYLFDLRPITDWQVLRFDEDRLPSTFTLTLEDHDPSGSWQLGVLPR